ncbi:MAG TPA: FadR/GntR family transcriptional regulator [Nocardioides sp.]|nr:FadR/GntR family transcriptional regulator [Nocardioides sp.]
MNLSDSPTAGHQIRRVSAMEALLAHLREAIETGQHAVGDKLPSEASLGVEYGVSRSVVREALRGLQALGLTQSRTGKGTFVVSDRAADDPTFGHYSAHDLHEFRRHVEVPATGYAAERHSPEDLAALRDLLDRMDRETDAACWVELDGLFHLRIAQASANPVFAKVIEEIRDALAAQSAFVNNLDDRRSAANAEHHRIVEAIASGSAEAGQTCMAHHLDQVADALGNIIGRDAASASPKENRS